MEIPKPQNIYREDEERLELFIKWILGEGEWPIKYEDKPFIPEVKILNLRK